MFLYIIHYSQIMVNSTKNYQVYMKDGHTLGLHVIFLWPLLRCVNGAEKSTLWLQQGSFNMHLWGVFTGHWRFSTQNCCSVKVNGRTQRAKRSLSHITLSTAFGDPHPIHKFFVIMYYIKQIELVQDQPPLWDKNNNLLNTTW